jgi:hypothetical protein
VSCSGVSAGDETKSLAKNRDFAYLTRFLANEWRKLAQSPVGVEKVTVISSHRNGNCMLEVRDSCPCFALLLFSEGC